MSQRLGYPVAAGEPYYVAGCASSSRRIFPNAMIPQRAWSSPAQHLLPYIPLPNSGDDQFSTGAFAQTVRDDKFAIRLDGNTRLNLRYTRSNASIMAGYTLSKSIDVASNLGEQVNPSDVRLTETPSAFDMRHNFVVSYNYDLPFVWIFRRIDALTEGWTLAGISRFSSGFPVTLYNETDSSLLGTFGNGVNNHLLDTPNVTPGELNINTNPAKGAAFNTTLFSVPPLGQLGNAPRRFFYGPGIETFDIAVIKKLRLSATKSLQIRAEAFNVFNHPQFYGAGAVDGNIVSRTFDQIVNAAPPRLVQIAVKYVF